MSSPRRALVTGGAGFIGSHLVDVLLARGDEVTVVDDLSTGRAENLAAHEGDPRLRVVWGDLRSCLDSADPGAHDEIYHLAAAVGVDLVMHRPIRAIEVNVLQTAELLRFAAERGTPTLVASSSEVYGKPTRRVFSEDDDVVYGPTSITRWSYAASKAIDEYLALAHARESGLPAVVVRLFNTVGPRQIGRYGMVLPRFVAAAVAGEPLRVFGDGRQTRCFCDVRDVAGALPRLLSAPGAAGRVYNLGADTPVTIRELAETVIRVLGSSSTIETVPYGDAYPPGYEDLQHRRPDLSRVRAAIGFEPTIGIERTILDIAEQQGRAGAAAAGGEGTA